MAVTRPAARRPGDAAHEPHQGLGAARVTLRRGRARLPGRQPRSGVSRSAARRQLRGAVCIADMQKVRRSVDHDRVAERHATAVTTRSSWSRVAPAWNASEACAARESALVAASTAARLRRPRGPGSRWSDYLARVELLRTAGPHAPPPAAGNGGTTDGEEQTRSRRLNGASPVQPVRAVTADPPPHFSRHSRRRRLLEACENTGRTPRRRGYAAARQVCRGSRRRRRVPAAAR